MRRALALSAFLLAGTSAEAQSSIAACGPLPDTTSKQAMKVFPDLRVCLLATAVVGTDAELPHEWAARGNDVILETVRPNDNWRAAIHGDRVAWTINGRPAPLDSIADRWQKAVLDLLDASYEADALSTRSSNLRTQIDSLPAQREAMRKRIDDIEDRERQLNQLTLEAQRREAAMRIRISNLESQQRQLESRANADERKAQSTSDERARRSLEASAANYRAQALRIDDQIRGLQRNEQARDETKRMVIIEEELRALNPTNSIALLKMKLANLDSTKVEDLEAELTQLDAPRRLPDLEARVESARRALLAILEARGKAPSR